MAILALFVPSILSAAQPNFQISPPPIPWYEFVKDSKDMQVGATLLYLTGDIDDPEYPEMGGSVDVYGGGASASYRYAFRKEFAIDVGGSAFYASGNVGKSADMNLGMLAIPVDLEFQPFSNDACTPIIFGGFSFSWMTLGIDINSGKTNLTADISNNMRGPQGGFQIAFKKSNFIFTPFFMMTSLSGEMKIKLSGAETGTYTMSVSAPTAYFYGIDIVYIPWNITLSSLIQMASSNSDKQGFQTYVFTVKYHFTNLPGSKGGPRETSKSADSID